MHIRVHSQAKSGPNTTIFRRGVLHLWGQGPSTPMSRLCFGLICCFSRGLRVGRGLGCLEAQREATGLVAHHQLVCHLLGRFGGPNPCLSQGPIFTYTICPGRGPPAVFSHTGRVSIRGKLIWVEFAGKIATNVFAEVFRPQSTCLIPTTTCERCKQLICMFGRIQQRICQPGVRALQNRHRHPGPHEQTHTVCEGLGFSFRETRRSCTNRQRSIP